MTDNEKLNLATRIYVRLRHAAGRTTDAVWMSQDASYAQEVLRLARMYPDPELRLLADRFELLAFGIRAVPVNNNGYHVNGNSHNDTGQFSSTTEMELSRYTGSLR